MGKITFNDKVKINELPDVPDINKVKDVDMNEIKTSVNTIYDALGLGTDTYSTSTSYVVGDKVIYDGMIYECTTATSGAWNSANWSLVPVVENDMINNELLPQVIESGTDYIKYYDGTMICYGRATIRTSINIQYGSAYRTDVLSITLSQTFVDTNYRVFLQPYAPMHVCYMVNDDKTTNLFKFYGVGFVNQATSADRQIDYVAIGKWK